jgi:release factor glutamine methyltransferase
VNVRRLVPARGASRRLTSAEVFRASMPLMKLRAALQLTVEQLAPVTSSARAEAEELLSRLLGSSRTRLYDRLDEELAPSPAQQLARWIERRRAGEPIQYVTGRAAFRELDLSVTPDVLVPRPETEILVERVLEILREERERWPAPRVLDLGTGSGAIALSIATELPAAVVTATDLSEDALRVAARNAEELGLGHRVRLLQGRWFEALGLGESFEAVVSNPPYIAEREREFLPREVRDYEPAAALFSGATGLEALREIVDHAPRFLASGGLLALEVAEARAGQVLEWMGCDRAWGQARLLNDLTGRPRVVLARRPDSQTPD